MINPIKSHSHGHSLVRANELEADSYSVSLSHSTKKLLSVGFGGREFLFVLDFWVRMGVGSEACRRKWRMSSGGEPVLALAETPELDATGLSNK